MCHMTYTEPMSRTARIVFRVQPDVRAAVLAEAKERGQSITEFAERALKESLSSTATGRKLAATLSEANGRGINEQSGPAPVPSTSRTAVNVRESESTRGGVRPAAPSQTRPTVSNFDRLQGASAGEDQRLGPARIAPVRKVKASTADLSPRANIGPKPLSATKPRPKAAARKAKP